MFKHKHTFKMWGHSGLGGMWSCKCGERTDREFTAEEKIIVQKWADYQFNLPNDANVHRHFHPFRELVKEISSDGTQDENLKLDSLIEKYANEHPEVKILGCDDSYFCSSTLTLIPHESKYDWMGLTVHFTPQCSGEAPVEFFLYPGHLDSLIEALKRFQVQQRKHRPKDKTKNKLQKMVLKIKY